jgi:hypothetical protein
VLFDLRLWGHGRETKHDNTHVEVVTQHSDEVGHKGIFDLNLPTPTCLCEHLG